MEPRTPVGGGVMGVLGNLREHKAQCSLWHFKAPSVSPPFKPLGMTHLWQRYITHHSLKAAVILPWKTALSWLILLSLWQRRQTSDQHHIFNSPCSVMAQMIVFLRRRMYRSEWSVSQLCGFTVGVFFMRLGYVYTWVSQELTTHSIVH